MEFSEFHLCCYENCSLNSGFYPIKFKNIHLYYCSLHTSQYSKYDIFTNSKLYPCAYCPSVIRVPLNKIYCCEKCMDVLFCEKCVFTKTRRAFDNKGVILCKKCEPIWILNEYKELWMFRLQYTKHMIDSWGDVLGFYVKPFMLREN
jgi:hypothetical protein